MTAVKIVGTGRCGTKWLTDMLNAAGIKATHEGGFRDDLNDALVDVSWPATGHLDEYEGHVIHLVRFPPTTLVSLSGAEVDWDARTKWTAERSFQMVKHGRPPSGDRARDALRVWLTYVELAQARADETIHLEDIHLSFFYALGRQLGVEIDSRRLSVLLLGDRARYRHPKPDVLTVKELRQAQEWAEMVEVAEGELGYNMEGLR